MPFEIKPGKTSKRNNTNENKRNNIPYAYSAKAQAFVDYREMSDETHLIGTIKAGTLVFDRVRHNANEYAVLSGKTLDDLEHVYLIKQDKSSGDEYYVNVKTRDKSWNLPDSLGHIGEEPIAVPEEVLANPWRARFIAFYEKYSPDRIPFIDPTLLQYPGREAVLMKALVRKYGPEPGREGDDETVAEDELKGDYKRDLTALRNRVVSIIKHYKPTKLPLVDKYMDKYAGQEEELIQFLVNKFGPEPVGSAYAEMLPLPSTDTSFSNKSVLQRESALLGFLQDREARLEAALNRNADLAAELSALREQNEGLLKEARDLRGAVDSESKRVEGDLMRIQNANALAAQAWQVEKSSLTAQLQSEASEAQTVLIAERLRFQEAASAHFKEKGTLLEEIQKNKEELDFCHRKTTELLEALDKKEMAILQLQRDHERATCRLSASRVTSSTQANGADIGADSPLALLTPAQLELTQALQNRISFLESNIQQLRFDCQQHSHVSQQLHTKSRALDSLTHSPVGSPASLTAKLTNAHSTVSALRSLNKSYEDKIAMLEMKLLTRPPAAATAADGSISEGDSAALGERLVMSEATVRAQRKEIADLRGLLAMYMSNQKKKATVAV